MKSIAKAILLATICSSIQSVSAQGQAVQKHLAPEAPRTEATSRPIINLRKPLTTYVVRYERYGLLGMYHVSLAVDVLRDGVRAYKLHIDGAGRLTKYEIPLGFCNLKFRFLPAYLAGSVNPRGYKKHFLGLLSSDEFGPSYVLNEEQGARLVSLAHHAITDINSGDKLVYCTIPFQIGPLGLPGLQIGTWKIAPVQIMGPIKLWTSNSVVASLIEIANKERIQIPKPSDGIYPGFDGPFLQKSLYEYKDSFHH